MTPTVADSAYSERTLWSFISESLEKYCEPARKTTAFVRSADLDDSQRCGVWLRLCLNEGCLHKMLETLANDMPAQQLRAWYQDHAFVRSDHMTVLLSLCAGLDEVTPHPLPHTLSRSRSLTLTLTRP